MGKILRVTTQALLDEQTLVDVSLAPTAAPKLKSILIINRHNLHDYPVHKKVSAWGLGLPLCS